MMSRQRSLDRHVGGYGRSTQTAEGDDEYMRNTLERIRCDAERRRREQLEATDDVDRSLPQPAEVDTVEFYCKDNAKSHQTISYDLVEGKHPIPVLRRGQPFFVAIRFNRALNLGQDKVQLELTFGPKTRVGKGTLVILPISGNNKFTRETSSWDIRLEKQEKNVMTLQIQIAPMAGVGVWRMKIISQTVGNTRSHMYDYNENIYILFNPWCKEDPVYMSDSTLRQEYVLNDVGKVYLGSHNHPVGRPWVFGQFEDVSLPASVFLLERSGLDHSSRANPVKVARVISAMLNSNDDNGVIVGNWTGNYEGGIEPSSWTGSVAILEKFLNSGGKPVRFGQCWVFSGVCTTVCRALGMPCRSVTNYSSAHDTDDTLTVDCYLDEDGSPLTGICKDSIWNFHVWNDCWMARPDLPAGYGGWQAIDATPQETSEGVYRTGPASVVAVRRGEIGHLYDAPFVFAEVNADLVHWQIDPKSAIGWKKLKTDTYRVGRSIVTKRPGFDDDFGNKDMQDISEEYKSRDGSREERMTVLNAAQRAGLTSFVYDMPPPGKEDVKFTLKDIDKVMIGKPFQVVVDVNNESDEKRTVQAVLSTSTVYYTGIIARKVKRARRSFVLKPRQREQLIVDVSVDDYLEKLVDYSMLKIYAIATVEETQQSWAEEDDFQIIKPSLQLEVDKGPFNICRSFDLRISFKNPLNKTLTDCKVTVEGPGLYGPYTLSLSEVPPNGMMKYTVIMMARKSGTRKITAVFSSRQLIEVLGSKQVQCIDISENTGENDQYYSIKH